MKPSAMFERLGMAAIDPRLQPGICQVKRRIRVQHIIWEGGDGLGPQEMDIEVYLNSYRIDKKVLSGLIFEANNLLMGKASEDAWPISYTWRFLS